ncbi:MAG: YCF48-related protein [Halobacteriota archaeon]|jgi:photosystem II stability/assembly factor-like uncharacterized protein
MRKRLPLSVLLIVLSVSCAKKVQPVIPQAPGAIAATRNWTEVHPPFKPTNMAAVRSAFWLCGPDEGIASSPDGGITWNLRHRNPGGKRLLSISFLNDEIGHAGGEGGVLLSTRDGGKTWNTHNPGGGAVQAFSFGDATHGIAVLTDRTGQPEMGLLSEVQGIPFLESDVKLTRDGGQHWEDVTALKTDAELRLYTEVLSVAALDSTHYVIGIRQPGVAVGYAVTKDGGTTWKFVHVDDVYATRVFVHNGEYWAFGVEYLDRQNHGGYGAPVSLHSKDGETWMHGVRGPHEFSSCTVQGCFLRDGIVEDLYGEHENFWSLPQDGTMSKIWAIAGNRACTIAATTKCGPAVVTEQP